MTHISHTYGAIKPPDRWQLPHNKLLKVLNNLTDFCFDGAEDKYITVKSYGARWVKVIKHNQMHLNKQQIKDAIAYLFLNCYFMVGFKIF